MPPTNQHASAPDDAYDGGNDDSLPGAASPRVVTDRARRLTVWVRVGLVVYWLALFAGTHLPAMPQVVPVSISDKLMHVLAYAGLSFLLAMVFAERRPIALVLYMQLLALVAIYGVVDEVLQTFVGRDCELGDWIADVIGASIGLACFHLIVQRRRR